MSDESPRQKLERECEEIQQFLVRFPKDADFHTSDVAIEWPCSLYAHQARAIRKALRLGLVEMAKGI